MKGMRRLKGMVCTMAGFVAASSLTPLEGSPAEAAARTSLSGRNAATCPIGAPKLSTTVASTPQGVAAMLAGQIGNEVSRQPVNVSADDLEAAIVFSISQSGAPALVALSALDRLSGCDYGHRNFQTAENRVRATLTRRRFTIGTSALAGASGTTFSDFSINLGGGTSNYSQ